MAALLIAKTSLAAESGVLLQLLPESHLATLTPAAATDVITLLGNLIDNAVDVSVGAQPARVTVHIDDRDGLTMRDGRPATGALFIVRLPEAMTTRRAAHA